MKDMEKMSHICNLIKNGGNKKFIIEAIAKYPNQLDEPITADGMTLLILAVKNCQRKVIQYLVKRQVDINKADKDKNTPLHHAFQLGFEGCIEILIDNGANESLENLQG